MLFRFAFGMGVVIGLSASLQAPFAFGQYYRSGNGQYYNQQQRMQQMQQMQPQQTTIDGTITGLPRSAILVTDKSNVAWKVTVPSDATIHVTGTATVKIPSVPRQTDCGL